MRGRGGFCFAKEPSVIQHLFKTVDVENNFNRQTTLFFMINIKAYKNYLKIRSIDY